MSNVRKIGKRVASLLKDKMQSRIDDLKRQTAILHERLDGLETRLTQKCDGLQKETECLLRGVFSEDPWLATAKDMHRGQRCFLLGCGPSLNKVDLSKLRGSVVMGVNGTYSMEEVQLTYFASVSHIFWKHHDDALRAYHCPRRFLPNYLGELASDCPTSWINLVDHGNYKRLDVPHPWGFSSEPQRYIFGGGTVIYVCLQILFHLGFSEVVLLGVDHDYGIDKSTIATHGTNFDASELHAHFREDYYPAGGKVHIDIHTSERAYRMAHEVFEKDGRRILNASPGTKLDVFPIVEFESLCWQS